MQFQENKELLLVGTVHGDPDGMHRLLDLLGKEKPNRIAVEVSPFGLAHRKRYGRRLQSVLRRRLKRTADAYSIPWKEWGQIQAIFAQIRLPFEYRASLRFCRDSGAVLWCLDLSSLSKRLIETSWEDLLQPKNLAELLKQSPEDLRASVKKAYARASELLREKEKGYLSAFVRDGEENSGWQIREASLAEGIKKRYVMMERGRMAYVGGWQHLLHPTDTGTLCDRLAHLYPRRLLLGDAMAS